MTDDTPPLKACPFCGSSASTMRGRGWSAACDGPHRNICPVSAETDEFNTEAGAIAAWNTRADLQAIEAMREALGEAFSSLTYIFECSDDEQASKVAKEAADKINAALSLPHPESREHNG